MPVRDPSILTRNLDALRTHNPETVVAIESADPAELSWQPTKTDAWSATRDLNGQPVTLASRFDPQQEAARLVKDLEPDEIASAALLGFGLGYHARAASETLGRQGVLVVFEPDAAQLRAVLEHIDHSDWLARPNVFLFGDAADRAAMTARLEPHAATLTQGTKLVTHPPSRRFHEPRFQRFAGDMTELLSFCRTNLATALVNAARTCRNLAGNLGHYAAGPTAEPLKDAAKGCVAVCVGAGPSLVRNVDLLRDGAVRKKVVVIAVQTALRPLLDRGIRPDFVTALDYSPICARFYEGLPELPDVTLVAEPKAHPAILDAFPGPVRLLKNDFCETALSESLRRPRTAIKAGATVAHLSVYLAEFLGCDPIVLIGQDLGFSDGLYYAPGTAVHRVWEPELSAINTIEMMEWVRVARMRGHLRRKEDIHGRPCFSDEQMLTYLKQFERDFKQMEASGTTVIDATEGGLPKAHTTRATLADALSEHATEAVPDVPPPRRALDPDRLRELNALLGRTVDDLTALRKLCRDALALIDDMRRCVDDRDKLARLFKKLDRMKARVHGELGTAFALVNTVNIIGAFHRQRSDRLIDRSGATEWDKLARQLDRDHANIRWLGQAGDEAITIFRDALDRARRLAKRHEPSPGQADERAEPKPTALTAAA